jgi:hypothetical protein
MLDSEDFITLSLFPLSGTSLMQSGENEPRDVRAASGAALARESAPDNAPATPPVSILLPEGSWQEEALPRRVVDSYGEAETEPEEDTRPRRVRFKQVGGKLAVEVEEFPARGEMVSPVTGY